MAISFLDCNGILIPTVAEPWKDTDRQPSTPTRQCILTSSQFTRLYYLYHTMQWSWNGSDLTGRVKFPSRLGQLMKMPKVQFLPRCMKCRRGLAMRILSVRLSVRPSVRRVICDKMEERSVQILYHTKEHLASFYEKKNGWWGATPSA